MRIDKPVKPDLPRTPAECEHWFNAASLEEISAEPKLHDEIVDPKWVPGDRQNGDVFDLTPPLRLLLSDHPHVALAWGKYLEAKWRPWSAQYQRWERVQKARRAKRKGWKPEAPRIEASSVSEGSGEESPKHEREEPDYCCFACDSGFPGYFLRLRFRLQLRCGFAATRRVKVALPN